MTDTINYRALADLAKSRGYQHAWGRHMIPGARLQWIWEHPKDGFQEPPFGHYPNALANHPWDALSLQPFDRHLTGREGDLVMARKFIALDPSGGLAVGPWRNLTYNTEAPISPQLRSYDPMNLAGILKDAMRRLARKEIRAETGTTRQAVAQYRRDIARLKREAQTQRKEIAFLKAQEQKRLGQRPTVQEPQEKVRFSARSVRAQRRRLKLSAADYGKLVGVSGLTIYSWEHGSSRPRKAQLASLAAVRGIGKREAAAKVELLKAKKQATKKARKLARRK